MATFTTPKGTTLNLMDLQGKLYMTANARLRWFREENPTWSIETELSMGTDSALCKAVIKDDTGRVLSTAHGFEEVKEFRYYREKAETAAVARALNHLGYGTQFDEDLDATGKPAEAPVERVISSPVIAGLATGSQITFGKYKGKTVDQSIATDGLDKVMSYADWLLESSQSSGKPLSAAAQNFINEVRSKSPINPFPMNDDVAL